MIFKEDHRVLKQDKIIFKQEQSWRGGGAGRGGSGAASKRIFQLERVIFKQNQSHLKLQKLVLQLIEERNMEPTQMGVQNTESSKGQPDEKLLLSINASRAKAE